MARCELDVHGMTQPDAVDAFVTERNSAYARAGRSAVVRVVHGYGSSGEDAENNPGVTLVTVLAPLPDARQRLGAAIVRYCAARPRAKARIARRFRRAGERAVADALREPLRQGRLRKLDGGHGGYRAS